MHHKLWKQTSFSKCSTSITMETCMPRILSRLSSTWTNCQTLVRSWWSYQTTTSKACSKIVTKLIQAPWSTYIASIVSSKTPKKAKIKSKSPTRAPNKTKKKKKKSRRRCGSVKVSKTSNRASSMRSRLNRWLNQVNTKTPRALLHPRRKLQMHRRKNSKWCLILCLSKRKMQKQIKWRQILCWKLVCRNKLSKRINHERKRPWTSW